MSRELEQVKEALAGALRRAGVSAQTAFALDWAKQYDAPVAAVGLRTGGSRGGALGSYLGTRLDPDTQVCREIYGLRLALTLSLDIYSPRSVGAADRESVLERVHQVLLDGLPAGLKAVEFKWEETVWDGDTSMFLRKGSLTCDAYFTAAVTEDGELLSDFILKGVVK